MSTLATETEKGRFVQRLTRKQRTASPPRNGRTSLVNSPTKMARTAWRKPNDTTGRNTSRQRTACQRYTDNSKPTASATHQ